MYWVSRELSAKLSVEASEALIFPLFYNGHSMFSIFGINNILIVMAFGLVAVVFLLPTDGWLPRLLQVKISKLLLLLILSLPPVLAVTLRSGVLGIIYFLLALLITWAFLFAFNTDRKYIYILALIFLGITPFLLFLKMDKFAEYSAVLSYLALVIGVFKDIFYEKIFN